MNLVGWLPVRIAWREGGPRVEWTLMGTQRLLDPFFVQTVQRQMAKPFYQFFRRETSMEEMVAWTDANPGAPLRGMIFHMSRCGSTLIGQQLAALEMNIVASEPEPLDELLQIEHRLPDLPRATPVRWLRALVAAMGQPRNGEQAFYLKADCWHIHCLDLLRDAFPETPWIFLYRDPIEVMVSQMRMPAAWTVPSLLHPSMLRMNWTDWDPAELDVYRARALAKVCSAGLRGAQKAAGGLLVNYRELPEAMYGRLLNHFGLREEDVPAMRKVAQQDAKSPGSKFVSDESAKQTAAGGRLREVVANHILEIYGQLETERLARVEGRGC
jgi:hypothetical protein